MLPPAPSSVGPSKNHLPSHFESGITSTRELTIAALIQGSSGKLQPQRSQGGEVRFFHPRFEGYGLHSQGSHLGHPSGFTGSQFEHQAADARACRTPLPGPDSPDIGDHSPSPPIAPPAGDYPIFPGPIGQPERGLEGYRQKYYGHDGGGLLS